MQERQAIFVRGSAGKISFRISSATAEAVEAAEAQFLLRVVETLANFLGIHTSPTVLDLHCILWYVL
ncbi:hypothetical protein M758_UG267400 [Ceratodon purpureus]|nr:hypothetical protein M758_UG267400 [Ceratodon purpureus]